MRAFTLIETLVAVFILTIGVLGAFALINQTLNIAPQASYQLTASYLAQEGLELVRNIRDNNWLEWRQDTGILWDRGLTNCATGCQIDYLSEGLVPYTDSFLLFHSPDFSDMSFGYQYLSGSASVYKRKITITAGTDKLLVSSRVSWQEKGRAHQVTAQTELYDWRKLNQ
jgi:type II secretory pathway pseudopilin PulG